MWPLEYLELKWGLFLFLFLFLFRQIFVRTPLQLSMGRIAHAGHFVSVSVWDLGFRDRQVDTVKAEYPSPRCGACLNMRRRKTPLIPFLQ